MLDKAKDLTSQAQDYLGSDHFKKILPYLISGGTGAVLGGVMSGKRRKRKGEGRLGYLGRILKNALLAAGGHALINKGFEKTVGGEDGLVNAQPEDGPLETSVRNISRSPITAGLAGGGTLLATAGKPRIGVGDTDSYLKALAKETGVDANKLRTGTPTDVSRAVGGSAKADRLRRLAGLVSSGPDESKLYTAGSWLRRVPGGLLGHSNARLAGRGALGLTAAGIPAILGALMTSPSQN